MNPELLQASRVSQKGVVVMSEQNKAVVRRLLEEGFNKGNEQVIDELVAPNYATREEEVRQIGREGFKELTAAFRTAFPDGRMVIEDIIAEGNRVVTWAYFTGTHRGPLEGIPPTGRRVKVKDADLFRVENGRVVESSTTFDRLGMLKQLGVITVPEGEGEM
jgi:steroid delta-isomerase-like uncharacterized protein